MPRLIHCSDEEPGIRRRRQGKGFSYWRQNGTQVKDNATLRRIRSLVLPPAWEDVWICPSDNGYIQATGIDAKGRKQYRYHPDWIEARESEKFERMIDFGKALPKIRQHIDRDLRRHGMPKEKAIAAVLALLESTLIRVGNEEYARQNKSYGLTTLLNRHAKATTSGVEFDFQGKSGIRHRIRLSDRRMARIVKQLQELPGQNLFSYLDDKGESHQITSSAVNSYLQEIVQGDFTAKDFRTWAATRTAFALLTKCEAGPSLAARKRTINSAIKDVAKLLGNTPAVCRKSYIHGGLLLAAEKCLPLQRTRVRDVERALIRFLESL